MLTKSRVMEQVWSERMLAGFDDVTVRPVTSKENACAAAACWLIDAGVKLDKMATGSGGCLVVGRRAGALAGRFLYGHRCCYVSRAMKRCAVDDQYQKYRQQDGARLPHRGPEHEEKREPRQQPRQRDDRMVRPPERAGRPVVFAHVNDRKKQPREIVVDEVRLGQQRRDDCRCRA